MRAVSFATLTCALLTACSGAGETELNNQLGNEPRDAAVDAAQPSAAEAGLDASAAEDAALPDAEPLDATSSEPDAEPLDATSSEPDAEPLDAQTTPDATGPLMVLALDFESALPANVNPGGGLLTPSQGFAPLGPDGNQFGETFLRSATANTVTITLGDLPPHSYLSLDFLFAAIDSLDGTGSFPAGDFFRVDLDGQVVFRESFANALPDQIQSYVPAPGVELARRVDLGFGGPGGYYTDSAYDMAAEPRFERIAHSGSSAVLTFTLEGEGVQDTSDESWAIDNVRVTVGFQAAE